MVEGAEEDPEELSEVHVVRRLLEPQTSAVVQIHGELGGETLANNKFRILMSFKARSIHLAQHLHRRGHLLLTDLLVLLLLGGGLQSLPWEAASVEVHENIAQTLHVISATLLNSKVGVDGGISMIKNICYI